MARGKLRIYLGAAPGVGKTYAMLSEAHCRIERGTDCVVAFVEHHHRPRTEVLLHGLEQVERREIDYRDKRYTQSAVIAGREVRDLLGAKVAEDVRAEKATSGPPPAGRPGRQWPCSVTELGDRADQAMSKRSAFDT